MEVAREALDLAKDAKHRIDSHEDICALRYKQLEDGISGVRTIITWAGTTGFAVILTILGFLMKNQFDANSELQKTVQNLQQHQGVYEQPK
jgi:hypothetical protein